VPDTPPSGKILQRLYDSEINAEVRWVWDGDRHRVGKAQADERC